MKEWIALIIGGSITGFAIAASTKIGWKVGDEISRIIVQKCKEKQTEELDE